jgi:hypothetical protein
MKFSLNGSKKSIVSSPNNIIQTKSYASFGAGHYSVDSSPEGLKQKPFLTIRNSINADLQHKSELGIISDIPMKSYKSRKTFGYVNPLDKSYIKSSNRIR